MPIFWAKEMPPNAMPATRLPLLTWPWSTASEMMDQNTGPCRSTMKLMRKYRTKAAAMSPGFTARNMITLNAKVTSCDQRKS